MIIKVPVYFVSGHRNITQEEFKEHYIPLLDEAINKTKACLFLVGDCEGVDDLAQQYIISKGEGDYIMVYHMFETPNYSNNISKCVGKFTSDFERDFEMTKNSDEDIAWIRHKRSGTQMNIDRRKWMNERLENDQSITKEDLIIRETGSFL